MHVIINHLDGTCHLLGPAPGEAYDEMGERRWVAEVAPPQGPAEAMALLERRTHPAWRRVKFDELLAQQLSMRIHYDKRKQITAPSLAPRVALTRALLDALPFALTNSQRKAAGEISADLARAYPMQRLLQGDVGSGKTIVAALAALQAIENGFQVAIMAPTEILAEQHFAKFSGWLAQHKVAVVWLGGNLAARLVVGCGSEASTGAAVDDERVSGVEIVDVAKGLGKGMGKVFKGPAYKKEDYLSTIFVVAKIMKTLKTEGAVALEAHIENPEASAIFGEYPKILHDHALLHLITDTVRLMVVSSSNLSPYAVEEVMDQSIKTHHHGELKIVESVGTLAGALPALGIVACVLGVVKTMAAIDQPPPVLGGMVGSAPVGTGRLVRQCVRR